MNDDIQQNSNISRQNQSSDDSSNSIADAIAQDSDVVTDYQLDEPDFISLDELEQEELASQPGTHNNPTTPPSVADARSISGHMPDPDADDNILSVAQDMGLALEEDDENPAELNIAKAVEEAEKEHWEN